MEKEQDNKLHFLDLTLEKNNHRFEYNIYRKPTYSDQTIHATSYHPQNQKEAAFNSMIHRLLNVPLNTQNYTKELNTIKYIARSNGYTYNLIDRILTRQQRIIGKKKDHAQLEV